MGQPLDKVTIKGFKSIRELDAFKLQKLNILIGGNGAGKSNFIDFFRMLRAMMKPDGLREFIAGNADAYLFGGPKQTSSIGIRMSFGRNGYDFELAPTEDGFFLINNEQRHYFPRDATRNLGSGNFNPALLIDKDKSATRRNASWFTYESICSWTIYHFHDTSGNSGMRRYHDRNHHETLFMDASNIAPYLLGLKMAHTDCYNDIVNTIRIVIPFFEDFILKLNDQENLRLDWRQKGLNDYPMRPSHLSDGSIRFICLAAALLQPNPPSTMIFDEPELGLHPEALSLLAEMIQNAAKRTQVIVATQSSSLINHFSLNDIIVVNRKDGQSSFERLQEKDFSAWMEDYSAGELWTKNVIAGGPRHE